MLNSYFVIYNCELAGIKAPVIACFLSLSYLWKVWYSFIFLNRMSELLNMKSIFFTFCQHSVNDSIEFLFHICKIIPMINGLTLSIYISFVFGKTFLKIIAYSFFTIIKCNDRNLHSYTLSSELNIENQNLLKMWAVVCKQCNIWLFSRSVWQLFIISEWWQVFFALRVNKITLIIHCLQYLVELLLKYCSCRFRLLFMFGSINLNQYCWVHQSILLYTRFAKII